MIVEIKPAIYLTCLHFVLSFHLIPFNTETTLSKPENARKQPKHVLADIFRKRLMLIRKLARYAGYGDSVGHTLPSSSSSTVLVDINEYIPL